MRKIKIIVIFIIFLFSFIAHFIYDISPNYLFSIFFPVNESIWEHMKLIATPVLIFSLFEYFVYKKKNIFFNNFLLSYGISIIISIFFYLIIYLPIDYIFGHSLLFAIILLFITFIILEYISYYLMNCREIKYSNILGIILIVFLYLIFGIMTYNPPMIDLFYDKQKEIYGIEKNTN